MARRIAEVAASAPREEIGRLTYVLDAAAAAGGDVTAGLLTVRVRTATSEHAAPLHYPAQWLRTRHASVAALSEDRARTLLTALRSEDPVRAIEVMLRSTDRDERLIACRYAIPSGSYPAALLLAPLLGIARSDDEMEAVLALRALAYLNGWTDTLLDSARSRLDDALRDVRASVRHAALRDLATLGSPAQIVTHVTGREGEPLAPQEIDALTVGLLQSGDALSPILEVAVVRLADVTSEVRLELFRSLSATPQVAAQARRAAIAAFPPQPRASAPDWVGDVRVRKLALTILGANASPAPAEVIAVVRATRDPQVSTRALSILRRRAWTETLRALSNEQRYALALYRW